MPSIHEAVGALVAADKPALFIDNCILLDIIRSTYRCLTDCAARAADLQTLVSGAPPACMLVISSMVPLEWNDNVRAVTEETLRHLREMEEKSAHFHDACQALGISLPSARTRYTKWSLAESLRDLSKSLMDRAIHLDLDAESRNKAVDRVALKMPPARRNREVKDCVIVEDYLAVCRGLQAAGLARKRVFCTSNTHDYCEATGQLCSELALDFAGCSLVFTTNLPWALHEVTH
jgi:hypothetical protein